MQVGYTLGDNPSARYNRELLPIAMGRRPLGRLFAARYTTSADARRLRFIVEDAT